MKTKISGEKNKMLVNKEVKTKDNFFIRWITREHLFFAIESENKLLVLKGEIEKPFLQHKQVHQQQRIRTRNRDTTKSS
jgi:hypothetical protein